jgi:uncharacterized NAD(P)/FAD-binding protein YdhS
VNKSNLNTDLLLPDNSRQVPLEIAIIGGGFCGTMTAVQLAKKAKSPLNIHIINAAYPLARGIAYSPYFEDLSLNVPNGRMSAFADQPDHFVNWLMANGFSGGVTAADLACNYSSRAIYGHYLLDIWNETLANLPAHITLNVVCDMAQEITPKKGKLYIRLKDSPVLIADEAVMATGNAPPRQPAIRDTSFFPNKHYFPNPWDQSSVQNLEPDKDILILGNGLTMADVVWALIENGFTQKIYTISTHGYTVQPAQEKKGAYTAFDISTLSQKDVSLHGLVRFFNYHRKEATKHNLSVHPLIDALRPYNQQIWQALSSKEKQRFSKQLRPLWDNIRHRAPKEVHTLVENLKAGNRLIIQKGNLLELNEKDNGIAAKLYVDGSEKTIYVERVINCTGPDNHPFYSGNELLKNMHSKGLLTMDELGIGIKTCPNNGAVIYANDKISESIFTIGTNLKGALWESTAIPELRVQAQKLAETLLAKAALIAPPGL